MPLPGGAADKTGNRYELLWTVHCMAQVLAGEAEAIRLEPPGDVGRGIEFVLLKDGQMEFHQAKRQQAGKGSWSIADLARADVLQHFRMHLEREPDGSCVFVSTEKAPGLAELADRARSSASVAEFETEFLTADLRINLADLRRRWNECDLPTAWALLRRIKASTIDDQLTREMVVSRLGPLVTGDPLARRRRGVFSKLAVWT